LNALPYYTGGGDVVGIFHGPDDPVYTISVAARLLRVSAHLLRQFEMEGLIAPARTDSNIRLYSDNDLRLLAKIIYLFRDCGINTQGIKVILAMEGDYAAPQKEPIGKEETGYPVLPVSGGGHRRKPAGRATDGDEAPNAGDCEDYREDYAKKNQ
jgi:MerR family transcriptional regulator/heat shock protein HspR